MNRNNAHVKNKRDDEWKIKSHSLFPCNIVVYEHQEYGDTVIGVIDPEMMVQATGRTDLDELVKSELIKPQTELNAVWS